MLSAWATTCHPAWDLSPTQVYCVRHPFRKANGTPELIGNRRVGAPEAPHNHCSSDLQRSKGFVYWLNSGWCPKPKIQVGSLERVKTGRTSLGVLSAGTAPASPWGGMRSPASGELWSVTQGQTQSYPLESFLWNGFGVTRKRTEGVEVAHVRGGTQKIPSK